MKKRFETWMKDFYSDYIVSCLFNLYIIKNIEVYGELFGENKLVKSVKLLLLNTRLISPIEKYPHIIGSYGCIL